MLSTAAFIALALVAWVTLSIPVGIALGTWLRRGQPPADARRHPAPPRLVESAA